MLALQEVPYTRAGQELIIGELNTHVLGKLAYDFGPGNGFIAHNGVTTAFGITFRYAPFQLQKGVAAGLSGDGKTIFLPHSAFDEFFSNPRVPIDTEHELDHVRIGGDPDLSHLSQAVGLRDVELLPGQSEVDYSRFLDFGELETFGRQTGRILTKIRDEARTGAREDVVRKSNVFLEETVAQGKRVAEIAKGHVATIDKKLDLPYGLELVEHAKLRLKRTKVIVVQFRLELGDGLAALNVSAKEGTPQAALINGLLDKPFETTRAQWVSLLRKQNQRVGALADLRLRQFDQMIPVVGQLRQGQAVDLDTWIEQFPFPPTFERIR